MKRVKKVLRCWTPRLMMKRIDQAERERDAALAVAEQMAETLERVFMRFTLRCCAKYNKIFLVDHESHCVWRDIDGSITAYKSLLAGRVKFVERINSNAND